MSSGAACPDSDQVARLRAYEFTSAQWPAWRFSSRAAAVRNSLGPLVFLAFLVTPVRDYLGGPHPTAQKVAFVAVVALYGVSYMAATVLRTRVSLSRRARVQVVVVVFTTGIAVPAVGGDPGAITLLTYAVVIAVLTLPLRYSRVLGVATIAAQVSLTYLVDGKVDWDGTWALVLVTVAASSILLLVNSIQSLREANRVIGDLAVTEERSRFARDLHDLLGHSLTTMTVKSGLARRVLEKGGTEQSAVDRAITEVREVEELSRRALTEVRAAVSGYHQMSLSAELVTARATLHAAGINAELPGSPDDLREDLREPYAWVLREGVTNVVKHSRAQRCRIRLGDTWLEVSDDGPTTTDPVAGNGLRGMADRLTPVGATVTWTRDHGWFTLRAVHPA